MIIIWRVNPIIMEQIEKPEWQKPENYNLVIETAWKLVSLYFMLKG